MALSSDTSSYRNYEMRNHKPNPAKCALLVIDMQIYFSEIAIPIIPALNTIINLCRSTNIPIIFTRHCHKSPSDYTMLGDWCNNDLIFDGTLDTELLSGLTCNLGVDWVVEKSTYSAFYGTGLEESLRGMRIEEVIISDVMTNVYCVTSARATFVNDFRAFFSIDAIASSDEVLHEATLKNMAFGFAYLVDCNRLECAFRDP